MMKITDLCHHLKWKNFSNRWLSKYFIFPNACSPQNHSNRN